jgi:hypothetical protein
MLSNSVGILILVTVCVANLLMTGSEVEEVRTVFHCTKCPALCARISRENACKSCCKTQFVDKIKIISL